MLTPLILLALAAAFAWYVADGMRAREAGIHAARSLCNKEGLQFLDDSVLHNATRIVRNDEGRVAFQRSYSFEFSDNGDNRLPGIIMLVGSQVSMLRIAEHQASDELPVARQCEGGCADRCH